MKRKKYIILLVAMMISVIMPFNALALDDKEVVPTIYEDTTTADDETNATIMAGCWHPAASINYVQYSSTHHSRICGRCGDGLPKEAHVWVLDMTLCSRCGYRP